jgi:alcohol dehydrogenase
MASSSLTMANAAAVPLVALTAWQALVERANLRAGERVLIQAGSGRVGTFAIQLATHLGATVAATTSAANVDLVTGLGADVVINSRQQDLAAVLSDYDVVLHSQDRTALEKSLRVLRPGGRLICISGPPTRPSPTRSARPGTSRAAARRSTKRSPRDGKDHGKPHRPEARRVRRHRRRR